MWADRPRVAEPKLSGGHEIAGQTPRATVLYLMEVGGLVLTSASRQNDHTGADSRNG